MLTPTSGLFEEEIKEHILGNVLFLKCKIVLLLLFDIFFLLTESRYVAMVGLEFTM